MKMKHFKTASPLVEGIRQQTSQIQRTVTVGNSGYLMATRQRNWHLKKLQLALPDVLNCITGKTWDQR